ncbi:MAG: SemiSWEET transporter [Planctomycetes bacterium]|nr:SemiSWEET transporter [Planctomycetota bacterium]
MDYITILGLLAGILTTFSFLPQAIKSWRSRHTKDISLLTFSTLAIGVALWLGYGIIKKDLPIILANAVSLLLVLSILSLKIRYK